MKMFLLEEEKTFFFSFYRWYNFINVLVFASALQKPLFARNLGISAERETATWSVSNAGYRSNEKYACEPPRA